jgi:hypothetical protein
VTVGGVVTRRLQGCQLRHHTLQQALRLAFQRTNVRLGLQRVRLRCIIIVVVVIVVVCRSSGRVFFVILSLVVHIRLILLVHAIEARAVAPVGAHVGEEAAGTVIRVVIVLVVLTCVAGGGGGDGVDVLVLGIVTRMHDVVRIGGALPLLLLALAVALPFQRGRVAGCAAHQVTGADVRALPVRLGGSQHQHLPLLVLVQPRTVVGVKE